MHYELPGAFNSQESAKPEVILNEQIRKLMDKGLPLTRIVALLGKNAEAFLTQKPGPKGAAVLHFDMAAFVQSQGSDLKLPDDYIQCQEKIIPPDEGESLEQTSKTPRNETRNNIPRIAYLTELISEMDLPYFIVEKDGEKKEGYIAFVLPSINKIVFVNNESDNATFIIHNAESDNWKMYATKTKMELKSLGPKKVSVVNYPAEKKKEGEEWKETLRRHLSNDPIESEPKPEFPLALGEDRTVGALAKEISLDNKTIKRLAEEAAKELDLESPYEKKKSPTGNVRDYLKHEIIFAVKELGALINSRTEAPSGWKTLITIAKEAKMDVSTVAKLIEALMTRNLELEKEHGKFANPNKMKVDYYGPRVIEKIMEISKDQIPAPDRWYTTRSLADKLKVDDKTIKRYVEICLTSLPGLRQDYIKPFKSPRGTMRDYLSPELIETITSKLENRRQDKDSHSSPHTIEQGSIHPDNS